LRAWHCLVPTPILRLNRHPARRKALSKGRIYCKQTMQLSAGRLENGEAAATYAGQVRRGPHRQRLTDLTFPQRSFELVKRASKSNEF